MVALDSAIIQHPSTWVASGHLAGFTDPLVDCRTCKLRFRADHIDQSACGRKPSKHPGETPECDLTEARDFNLMFETSVGPVKEEGSTVYLRPETAQGIFLNFKNYLQFARKKPPFGIAQIGKSFRNEITTGNFIFRTREFEQMEMEFFVPPDEAERWFEHWLEQRMNWWVIWVSGLTTCGFAPTTPRNCRTTRAATSDVEYLFPIGWSELEGIANRGDFDLTQHAKHSGQKLEYVDTATGERYVPHVIEPAAGVDRAMLAFMVDAYDEDEIEGEPRTVLRLHPQLAPVKVAVLPLVKKDGQPELAGEVYRELRERVQAEYDEGGAIGRRYRRQDEIGTPWAVTIDHQSLQDRTVTLRDRDSLAQDRIAIADLGEEIERRLRAPWSHPSSPSNAAGPSRPPRPDLPNYGGEGKHEPPPRSRPTRSPTRTCTAAGSRATGAPRRSISAPTASSGRAASATSSAARRCGPTRCSSTARTRWPTTSPPTSRPPRGRSRSTSWPPSRWMRPGTRSCSPASCGRLPARATTPPPRWRPPSPS